MRALPVRQAAAGNGDFRGCQQESLLRRMNDPALSLDLEVAAHGGSGSHHHIGFAFNNAAHIRHGDVITIGITEQLVGIKTIVYCNISF